MNSPPPLPPPFDPSKSFQPVWRQAFLWLNQCHVLPPEAIQILTLPHSTIEDLADVLSDGIVLCNLLNYLVPGIIKYTDVSCRPQRSRFLCLQNIRLFLDTCRRELNFRDRDLFDPYMLFDKYDLDKIVETLSKISRLDVAKRKKLTPFPMNSPVNYMNIQKDDGNSMLPVVRSLDETVPTQEASEDDIRVPLYYASPDTLNHQNDQSDLYGCLIEKKRDNHKAFLPRDHCVKELLDTELNYRDSLNQIVKHFIEPLQLKPEEKKRIFLNILEIQSLHIEFYEDLRIAGRNEKGRTSRIVDLFSGWQDKFLIYARYCSELPDAQEFLDRKIKQDQGFSQKLEQCRQKAGELGKFQLRDTVVLPFQRIVKYSLLLHTMKKNVPSTDANGDMKRQLLEKAESLMMDVNQYINEAKRAYDNLKVISNIEKSICDIKLPSDRCLRTYGRFIADDQFTVHEEGHRGSTRTVFLFDRILLICKVKGSEKYTFRSTITIAGCTVEELKATRREFPLNLRDCEKREYKFVAKTEEKRLFWLKILREAIDRCSNPELFENGHYFQMKSFDEINPRCDVCSRYLCGIFYQAYECGRCQRKTHRECIKKVELCYRTSLGRIRSFDRGPIELPHAFISAQSSISSHHRVHALYDYDGAARTSRIGDRHIRVNEGDELEVIEDDDEHVWKVKNLRTNEIGLIPATLVGTIDGDQQKIAQRTSTNFNEIPSMRSNISMTLAQHFPFIRSLVQAYSSPVPGSIPYSHQYSDPMSPKSSHRTNPLMMNSNPQIQRSKSISSPTTPEHVLYRHRSLQLSSSYDNKRASTGALIPDTRSSHFYDWYLDTSRHEAEDILRHESVPNNTFLVRKQGKNEGHAISIKHNHEIYHIRIYTQEVDGVPRYYLVDGLHFDSLQALVQYYQVHSLEDRFPPVKSSLVHPIAQVCNHDKLLQPATL